MEQIPQEKEKECEKEGGQRGGEEHRRSENRQGKGWLQVEVGKARNPERGHNDPGQCQKLQSIKESAFLKRKPPKNEKKLRKTDEGKEVYPAGTTRKKSRSGKRGGGTRIKEKPLVRSVNPEGGRGT